MDCYLCKTPNIQNTVIGKTEVYQCQNCELIIVPNYGNEVLYHEDYYIRLRKDNEQMNFLREKQYEIEANHFVKNSNQGKVLDIGSSTGGFMEKINNIGNFDLYGIDIDKSAIEYAKKKYNDKANMHFYCNDLINCDFEDNTFDNIIFRGTLPYISDKLGDTFKICKKILKHNGKLIIYFIPNSDSFLFYLLKDNWQLFNAIEHKILFNTKSVKFLCEQFNLEIEELSYPYIESAYSNSKRDYENLKYIIKENIEKMDIPFWGNIIQLVAKNCK